MRPCSRNDNTLRDATAEGRLHTIDEAVAYATRARGRRDRATTVWDAFAPAEQAMTELVSEGCTNQEIADRRVERT